MLAERNAEAEGPCLVHPLPGNRAVAGPWLLAEAKQYLAKLRDAYPKTKDLERHLYLGLTLKAGEAHVVPGGDPEADALVNPKYLIDGLGAWPAEIRWQAGTPVVIRVAPDLAGETRYWIACVVRKEFALAV